MRVLMFHGLDDWALSHAMLNRTWEWLDKDLTLVTVPGGSAIGSITTLPTWRRRR